MKYLLLFLLVLPIFAQNNFFKHYDKIKNSISVGDTFQEVKRKFGKPQKINPGCPTYGELMFAINDPDYFGPNLFNTWVYQLKKVKLQHDVFLGGMYWINGETVNRNIYNDYIDKPYFYKLEEGIVELSVARHYELLKDNRLEKIYKDPATSGYFLNDGSPMMFTPLLYIVFEKSSNMVASVILVFIPA